jgi:hypothetical protein
LLDLEKHLKKKAEWRKGIGEHSVPRERHGIYCEGQRVLELEIQRFPVQDKHGFQNFCFCLVPGL